jgi:hypothetical protein
MKTKTINIYQYSELSEKAKEVARQWYLEGMDNSFCWENTQYDASEIGLIIESLDDHRPNKGFFVLSASDTANKILVNHGEDCETYKDAKEYLEKVVFIRSSKLDESEMENELEMYETNFLNNLLEDYRIMLNRDIEYQQSEACIAESMQANEYDFFENGKRA